MDEETLRPVARNLLRTYMVRSSRSRDLATALMKGKLHSWSEGESLCIEGEVSDNMFVILKGQLRVLRKDVNGENKELAVLDPPAMVGQMGLVDGSPRSATCQAATSLGALVISQKAFNDLLEEASSAGSSFRHLLLSSMTRQLTTANQKIRNLITDLEREETAEIDKSEVVDLEALEAEQRSNSSERLLQIAGVLNGWKIETEGVDDVQFYEDEDMKRTREARERKR
jgi:CRP-like cAMP-binding protein